MKQFLLSICLLIGVRSIAQESSNIDERLLARYDVQYLEHIAAQQSQLINQLSFYLDHAYFVQSDVVVPQEKLQDFSDIFDYVIDGLPEDVLKAQLEVETFNVCCFDAPRAEKMNKAYRLGDTDKLIVFYSTQEFMKMYNEQRQ